MTDQLNNNNEDKCIICMNNINENDNIYKLNCNHVFHTTCIMNWFRSDNSNGKCPCCLDTDNINIHYVPWYTKEFIETRYKELRKLSRTKKSPDNLKKDFDKIKMLENKNKDNKNFKTEYEKSDEYKQCQKKYKKLRSDYWKSTSKLNKEKVKLVTKHFSII